MKLAIKGGTPVKEQQNHLRHLKPIFGKEELVNIEKVLSGQVLSDFIADYGKYFEGGKFVKEFEKAFAEKMGSKYAISFNSATSALHASVFACDIGLGDEVITNPISMTATVTSILMQNAIPVFADITYETHCHSVESVEQNLYIPSKKRKISSLNGTKAILTVNLWGGTPELDKLRKLADKQNIYLIEDNAQAPLGEWKGKLAGTYGDMGIFSLNCHKVINCGEGGVLITDNDELAFKAKLIRNHAEAVIEGIEKEMYPFPNMLGYNYRMTEIQAAIALAQLEKLDAFTDERIHFSHYLMKRLAENDLGIIPFSEPKNMKHVYYVCPAIFDSSKWKISKQTFVQAMQAEGFLEVNQVGKPIYLMKFLQRKQIYASSHFPFMEGYFRDGISYDEGLCPVAEDLYHNKHITIYNLNRHGMTEEYVDKLMLALEKVFIYQDELL